MNPPISCSCGSNFGGIAAVELPIIIPVLIPHKKFNIRQIILSRMPNLHNINVERRGSLQIFKICFLL